MKATQATNGTELGADPFRNAWSRFWFRPTDPTTLGFMRIVAGVLVFYITLAQTFDFKAFFGPEGWWDQKSINRERLEQPYVINSWGWGQEKDQLKPIRFQFPVLADRRIAAFEFLKHLPNDKAQRDEALEYLYFLLDRGDRSLPVPENNYRSGIMMLKESAELLDEQRERMVVELGKEELRARDMPITAPDFFLQMPPAERVRLWNRSFVLLDHLVLEYQSTDAQRNNFNLVLDWLREMPFPERKDFANFLRELPSGEEGRKILDYYETWHIDPRQTTSQGKFIFSLWFHLTDVTTMWWCHGLILFVMFLFTIGLFTRVTSVMTWLSALFYIHRTHHVLYGMDTMLNVLLIYLMIGPSGATLSIDRLIARYRAARAIFKAGNRPVPWADAVLAGPQPSVLANFTIRLFQIHFCFIYMASGLAKLNGQMWWNAMAIWDTVANPEFTPMRFQAYQWLLLQLAKIRPLLMLVCLGGTYFTLFLEIALPFLIWTRLRPVMVAGGVLLHAGIACVMGLTCFSLLSMTLLLCYIPAATIRERLAWSQGSGKKMTLRYNNRNLQHARLVGFLRAFDLTGQIALQEDASKNPEAPIQLIDADNRTHIGYDIVTAAANTLQLMRLFAWNLWIPGVPFAIRRFVVLAK